MDKVIHSFNRFYSVPKQECYLNFDLFLWYINKHKYLVSSHFPGNLVQTALHVGITYSFSLTLISGSIKYFL